MTINLATVVIGAGYGDEGKGLFTDYSAKPNGLVIRFNGGAQAGHTVETPQGLRHVFGHFGSGTFKGASTFLSKHFVVNPTLYCKELNTLQSKGISPSVIVDDRCVVTTPFDMLINQVMETSRGASRHGSCGVGFGETIERSEHSHGISLTVADLRYEYILRNKLTAIAREWSQYRLDLLGLVPDSFINGIFNNANVIDNFIQDCYTFITHAKICRASALNADQFTNIVFEGAQGLMLDQDYGAFPHVTRSNTGLKNVNCIAAELDISKLNVIYATRSYVTRHGAGPLRNALPDKPYVEIVDKTNIPNDYQGSLRFAYLDAHVLKSAIANDISKYGHRVHHAQLGITCIDQLSDDCRFYNVDGELVETYKTLFSRNVACNLAMANLPIFESTGPTRDTIRIF